MRSFIPYDALCEHLWCVCVCVCKCVCVCVCDAHISCNSYEFFVFNAFGIEQVLLFLHDTQISYGVTPVDMTYNCLLLFCKSRRTI